MRDPSSGQETLLNQVYELLGKSESARLGDLIEARQEELGISERQMCRVLNINKPSLRRIISGKAQKVDLLTLLKLGNFLQLDVEDLVKSFVAAMEPEDVRSLEITRVRNFLVSNFDLTGLREVGFIRSITDFSAIEERVKTFFGLDSVFEYNTRVAYPLYSRTKRPGRDKMKEFWVRSAYSQFEKRPNPNEFDRDKLLELVPQIHQYTRFESRGFLTVARALYEIGVTVIGQSYLPFTQVRGATFIVDGKPCIVVTDYRNDYGTLWFALMHEIAHVLYHLDKIESYSYHLSGNQDLMLIEDEANYFARELLISEDKLEYIESLIDNPHIVKRYARKYNIHPSLIYSFHAYRLYLQEDDSSAYAKHRQHMIASEPAIDLLRCHPWDNETVVDDIDKAINQLKQSNA